MIKSPVVRLSLGLMFITISVLLFGNFIGLIPDQSDVLMEARKSIAESLAVRSTYEAQNNNAANIRKTIDAIVESYPDILSLGMRNAEGKYLAQTRDHQARWVANPEGVSTAKHWEVPIYRGSMQWGTLEISFAHLDGVAVMGYRVSRFTIQIIFLAFISFIGFVLFMKRALRYLDPSSVIPRRVKYALDTLTEGVLLLDTKERIVLANAVFSRKLGYSARNLMGVKASQFYWVDPDTDSRLDEVPWLKAISQGETQSGTLLKIATTTDGIRKFIVNSAPVLDDKGKSRGAVVTFDDITVLENQRFQLSRMVELLKTSQSKIEEKNKELEILASKDSLTGCLNRRAFYAKAEQYFAISTSERKSLACIMLDIDNFKSVNDTYGHLVGDEVIQHVVKMIQSSIRIGDEVCRYGGEEFCILLPNCNIEDAAICAEKIRGEIATTPAQVESQSSGISVSASFGVSDLSLGERTIDELLEYADNALFIAKEGGRNRVVSWDSDKENELFQKKIMSR